MKQSGMIRESRLVNITLKLTSPQQQKGHSHLWVRTA
jgi:hypothetical protein